jgi:hypothetical protein
VQQQQQQHHQQHLAFMSAFLVNQLAATVSASHRAVHTHAHVEVDEQAAAAATTTTTCDETRSATSSSSNNSSAAATSDYRTKERDRIDFTPHSAVLVCHTRAHSDRMSCRRRTATLIM